MTDRLIKAIEKQRIPEGWRLQTGSPRNSTAPFLTPQEIEFKLKTRGTTDPAGKRNYSSGKTPEDIP